MALKEKKKLTPVTPQDTVDESSVAPENLVTPEQPDVKPSAAVKSRVKDVNKEKFYDEFKNSGIERMKEESESGVSETYGSASDKVSFLHPLGNPTKVGTRTEKGKSGIPTIEVIGYAFKANDNIQVPVIDRTGIPKNNIMGFNSVNWVPVKKGEIFQLSRGELGQLIQLPEYNGMFTGDPNNIVELQITISKAAGNKYVPLSILKKTIIDENTTPIKANIVPVAIKKEGATGNGLKEYTVLPEYVEKFGYIFEESQSVGRAPGAGSQKRERGQTSSELAAALRAYSRNTGKVQ